MWHKFLIFLFLNTVSCNLSYDFYKKIFEDSSGKLGGVPEGDLMKLFDASSKFVISGIRSGHTVDIGAYDECIGIDDEGLIGKYCMGTLTLKDFCLPSTLLSNETIRNSHNVTEPRKLQIPCDEELLGLTLKFGVCVTEEITADRLNEVFKDWKVSFDEAYCQSKNSKEVPDKVRIVMCILLFFFALAILSTIYDVIRERMGLEPFHQAAIAFSMYSNGKKLIKTSSDQNQLLCINGLKTLNMLWVVAGHTYSSTRDPVFFNQNSINEYLTSYASMIIQGSSVDVDSFLTITGILIVYTSLKTQNLGLRESFKSIPMMYLHRYIRLTPALAIVIMLYATSTLDYVWNSPFWYRVHDYFVPECEKYWWSVLLYVENYVNPREMCMIQSWYLAVDMQLFLITPFIVIPLRKWRKRTLTVMYFLVILGFIVPFTVAYLESLPGMPVNDNPDFGPTYYSVPHTRFGPYIIGMCTGYHIHKFKKTGKEIKNKSILNIFLWLVILGILYVCVFVPFPLIRHTHDERLLNAVYIGCARNIWSICIALTAYLCTTGNGGIINWFLSLPIMQFIAKISYSIYLTHLIVIVFRYFSVRTELYFSTFDMLMTFGSIILTCIFVGTIFCLIFESPMIVLEKIIFGKSRSKQTPTIDVRTEGKV